MHRSMPKQPLFVHQPNNSVCSSGRRDWRLTHALATCSATQIRFYLRAVTHRASCHYVEPEKNNLSSCVLRRGTLVVRRKLLSFRSLMNGFARSRRREKVCENHSSNRNSWQSRFRQRLKRVRNVDTLSDTVWLLSPILCSFVLHRKKFK